MVAGQIQGETQKVSDFFRFPHTPHIAWLGEGTPRDDKVLAPGEATRLLSEEVTIEEKVDGANLGFSIGPDGQLRVQNRGQYLERPFTGQFSRLNAWLAGHEFALQEALAGHLILFGEWSAATHSIAYDQLPDYFLVFDIYDRSVDRFWSTNRRNAWATGLGLTVIRPVGIGIYSLSDLKRAVQNTRSRYRDGPCEGIYLRWQDTVWLTMRAKLVRPDFVQGIETHWRSRALRWNTVRNSAGVMS